MFDLNKRWLNCMKITWVPMLAQALGTLIHIGWCHLFTVKLEMGVTGLGIATAITYFTMLIIISINAYCITHIREAIFFPTVESFRDWGEYFHLSVPATVMICAEWWSFEILVILSGILGVVEQGSQVITFNVCAQMFMVPLGMQEAACAIIGNEIGAGNVSLAKKYYKIVSMIAGGALLVISVACFFFR